MADIFNMLDTWNAGATVFTGIKLSVTDTASDAGSLLMDLQVGGVSRFKVDKNGSITVPYPYASNFGNIFGGNGNFAGTQNGLQTRTKFGFSSAAPNGSNADLLLERDAANTLAQRNGVNAQAFNLYNTYTDASNYERGAFRYDTNLLGLFSQALGTGTVRNMQIGGTGSGLNTHMLVGVASRLVRFNHSGTVYFEVNTSSGEIKLALDRTLSQLSASPAVGMIARVTDATAPTIGSTVTGGGASAALCWYNGTNWTVIGV